MAGDRLKRVHVILIQPLDPPQPIVPLDSAYGDSHVFAPAWDLLCLRAYLLGRTRHTCSLIDCRLMGDVERELIPAVRDLPRPAILVVRTTALGLGEAVGAIEITTRYIPGMKIALCGPFATEFPGEACSIPHVDFVLAGDPEPILRNLLDYADNEQRLQRVPGLLRHGAVSHDRYWLDDLRTLSLPDWQGIFWPAYQHDDRRPGTRVEMRLSRGHSRTAADRAEGGKAEPLRVWPFDRAASCIQKCGHRGITEIVLADPPGFWNPARIDAWCQELVRARSTQPWSLRTPPATWLPAHAENLAAACCRRVEWILPTSDPLLARQFGIDLNTPALKHAAALLQDAGIDVQLRFFLGGPDESPGEASRVCRVLDATGFLPFSAQALPLNLDSPLAAETPASEGRPGLAQWAAWSRDPWMQTRPVALWGGAEQVDQIRSTMEGVKRLMKRSPRRLWRRAVEIVLHRPWLRQFEDWAVGLFHRLVPPRAGP
jgi:hypothetical protein